MSEEITGLENLRELYVDEYRGMTRDELIDEIQRLKNKLGRICNKHELWEEWPL